MSCYSNFRQPCLLLSGVELHQHYEVEVAISISISIDTAEGHEHHHIFEHYGSSKVIKQGSRSNGNKEGIPVLSVVNLLEIPYDKSNKNFT